MNKTLPPPILEEIFEKAFCEYPLKRNEIAFLLSLKEKEDISNLFRAARILRERYFGNRVFLYGFIYFSTYCRNNCTFCSSRKANPLSLRYRKEEDEILRAADSLARSGVHLIDLTMGEDPLYYGEKGNNLMKAVELVRNIKKQTGLPLMVSPGVVPAAVLREFARGDADWYACYQETHNRKLFNWLRTNQDYDTRLRNKILARDFGMLIEEGILTGVGERGEDIISSLEVMQNLGAHQIRVMSFTPQTGTPMADRTSPPLLRELLITAVMRLLFPDRLIPASLDTDGAMHLSERLEAGANVVTSLIPPHMGLSGVSQTTLGIDDGSRTANGILPILYKNGLEPAILHEYRNWIAAEKEILRQGMPLLEVEAVP